LDIGEGKGFREHGSGVRDSSCRILWDDGNRENRNRPRVARTLIRHLCHHDPHRLSEIVRAAQRQEAFEVACIRPLVLSTRTLSDHADTNGTLAGGKCPCHPKTVVARTILT
jgi:hypothetical protein